MRKHIRELAPVRDRLGQHAGLLLQRRLAVQSPSESDRSPAARQQKEAAIKDRRALFDAAIRAVSDPSVQALYRQAFARWAEAFPDAPDGSPPRRFTTLQSSGRLIVGLGAENVLETGLRLHHTYGLPVVPGSALKGLASHYCDRVWGQQHLGDAVPDDNRKFRREGSFHDLLFGFTRDEAEADAGAIVFHDAWITPETAPNCLCPEVMTPHHPRWQNGTAPPTDFDSPIPVSFLSVAGAFRVGVSWAGPADERAKNWTELALTLLTEALKEWGIGGKTSSGYGRLALPPPPAPPQLRANAIVVVIERRDVNGKPAFKVQEAGRPKPGMLQFGPPPAQLPNVGDTVTAYWNNTELNNPQYRWDVPPPRPGNRPRR